MQTLPAGSWPSPLTATALVGGSVSITAIVPDGAALWWAEQRPDEGGRTAIVRWNEGIATEVTPPDANVRTRVHEYGGGAWWAAGGVLFYADDSDQRLRMLELGADAPVLLTDEPDRPRGLRYADGRPTPDGRWYVCVRERHRHEREPANELVAVATDGSGRTELLAEGADFYAAPRVSPDGTRLAWIQWDHPNMPWDATELWLVDFDASTGTAGDARKLAGRGDEALQQPEWAPDGRLFVVTDRTGWWNVYAVELAGDRMGQLTHVAGGEYDVVLPHWVFGGSRYTVTADGTVAHVIGDPAGDRLAATPAAPGPTDVPYTAISELRAWGDGLALVGASHQREADVVRTAGDRVEVVRPARELPFDPAFLPDPELVEFPTGEGQVARGLFYAPAHRDVTLPEGELPPVIVAIHGGPTAQARRSIVGNHAHRFWTSRGIAVFDLDYRGSSGYGRAYRNLLRGRWCDVDVADAAAAVAHLAAAGRVDGARAIIRGGSAGGSTVLLALATTERFATGASYFGVADLAALITDDHKFESRYTFQLIGPYPEDAERYAARSPINHVDELTRPLIVFQGLDDAVVPPAHSEMIVDAVRSRGVPVAYLTFEGEGHGFRRTDSQVRALEAELWFYGHVLGFAPADTIEPVL